MNVYFKIYKSNKKIEKKMILKKSMMSSNMILCILIYVIQLKKIWKNENLQEMDEKTQKILFMKKITEMGNDLLSKNFIKFSIHALPYSMKMFRKIKDLRNKFIKKQS
jgi:hypothetical protein